MWESKASYTIHPSLPREGQVDCVKLLASRGAGLDAKTEVEIIEDKPRMCKLHCNKHGGEVNSDGRLE